MEREAKLGLALSAALALLIFAGVIGVKALRTGAPEPEPMRSEQPSPEYVVEALQDEGLVESDPIPIEEWANDEYADIPKEGFPTKNGVHFFYVGQTDESYGGDVCLFESQEDLEEVSRDSSYYSYYQQGLLLLRLYTDETYGLSQSQADCFGREFTDIVQGKTGNRGAEEPGQEQQEPSTAYGTGIPPTPCDL